MKSINATLLEVFSVILLFSVVSCHNRPVDSRNKDGADNLMIRMAEIEVDSIYFDEYISILKEEAAASFKLEPGVLCIYPMYQKNNPSKIQLLEIYANEEAYRSHLETPHFLHYKTATMPMVKSLKLIDMEAIDREMMSMIFAKIQ